ncbi:hypothetical protein BCR44DRAFT_174672 [Catenaria anguillulae PL171]|uniref:Uncharacterized protein n=1 Tax=Catenaria anguillulae PL171 TaxID=765915 RepID=A0A1Y2H6Z2_9FUNG|nr:hypothetical protein BCR44DRAFT_174672 [Catenaria anguillulae PL171]
MYRINPEFGGRVARGRAKIGVLSSSSPKFLDSRNECLGDDYLCSVRQQAPDVCSILPTGPSFGEAAVGPPVSNSASRIPMQPVPSSTILQDVQELIPHSHPQYPTSVLPSTYSTYTIPSPSSACPYPVLDARLPAIPSATHQLLPPALSLPNIHRQLDSRLGHSISPLDVFPSISPLDQLNALHPVSPVAQVPSSHLQSPSQSAISSASTIHSSLFTPHISRHHVMSPLLMSPTLPAALMSPTSPALVSPTSPAFSPWLAHAPVDHALTTSIAGHPPVAPSTTSCMSPPTPVTSNLTYLLPGQMTGATDGWTYEPLTPSMDYLLGDPGALPGPVPPPPPPPSHGDTIASVRTRAGVDVVAQSHFANGRPESHRPPSHEWHASFVRQPHVMPPRAYLKEQLGPDHSAGYMSASDEVMHHGEDFVLIPLFRAPVD